MFRATLFYVAALASAAAIAAETETVDLKTLRAQMRYSVTEINARPGESLKIVFENTDDMPHNFVLCKAGTDVVALANKQLEKPDEAVKRNFIPDDPAVILHSKLLGPHEKEVLSFTTPETPGDYPYVCTMPGHAMSMNGRLRVQSLGKGLTNLHFKLYNGSWDKLPDFSKLPIHREGDVADNLVQLKFDDYKNDYGVVFDGKIASEKDGDYTFVLASDDGSRLSIDGHKIIDHDGIHPSTDIREGKVHLKPGEHDFHLEYFQKGGEAELYAGWKGPGFSITPLSAWHHPNWAGHQEQKRDEHSGMPLIVEKEPIIYRNFISGAGTNRAIAVGYPGDVNIAWNADSMNLGLIWRGAFMDAARHWTDRGGGFQPPLGYDVLRPAGESNPPFANLATPDAEWPKTEHNQKADRYKWRGYRLDAKHYPTFFYDWGAVKVSDRYDVEGNAVTGSGKLVRTLKLDGEIPAGAYFRAASGTLHTQGSGFLVDGGKFNIDGRDFENAFVVVAEGAAAAGHNLVVPVRPEIKITYGWPMDHTAHLSAH